MKNRNTSKKASESSKQSPSNVRSYFTKEINDQIEGMSSKEMETTMKDLINTQHWIALLKYTSLRMLLLDATLRGTDPLKDPSKILWAQGAMAGLSDVETYVIEINNPTPQSEEVSEESLEEGLAGSNPGGTIIGS